MRRLLEITRMSLMARSMALSVLLGLGTMLVAPTPAAAHPVQVSPLVRYPVVMTGQMVTGTTVQGAGKHPFGWYTNNPFAYCSNDRAYILGFQWNGAFVDGIAENLGDVQMQLLYLWCPSWLPWEPDGLNFAMVQVQNITNACALLTLGKAEPGNYFNAHFTLNAYDGVSLVDQNGFVMATPAPPRTTQTLCPGQRTTWFSGVTSGRFAYYAMVFFDVAVPTQSRGWTDVIITPYPR